MFMNQGAVGTYEINSSASTGATVRGGGVAYRVWAPAINHVTVEIAVGDGVARTVPLLRDKLGYHSGFDPRGRDGDAYMVHLEGVGRLPDPASRAQRDDVHGWSLVVDPGTFAWSDTRWQRPDFRDLVIYEIHIGTFSQPGTFLGACEHLPALRDLGVNAIQIMPIADFPGMRNWGYDGVLMYAPARCYGTPDDLRTLVDQAHAHGIAVILDVVYNHFGPDGNYLARFGPDWFNAAHHTPWGSAFNFDAEMSGPVRDFFLQNPVYWMDEFHIDGFRLDATHEIQDDSPLHILAEMTQAIRGRHGYAIAEDDRNSQHLVRSIGEGGLGFNAVWADDFHHSVRVSQTGENFSYFADYEGTAEEMISALDHGWVYRGQNSQGSGKPRGTTCRHLPPEAFIHCISNHDQVGNRAFGERLSASISSAEYRMLSALLCLSPYTPMLFMGQEWAASTPFLYFTHHKTELGHKITQGRRKEFAMFPEFSDATARTNIPDPQSEETFLRSKLQWEERAKVEHAGMLALYAECLCMRRTIPAFRPAGRQGWCADVLPWGVGVIRYEGEHALYQVIFDPSGGHSGPIKPASGWKVVFSSDDPGFGGNGGARYDSQSGILTFSDKALVVLSKPTTSELG